MPEIDLVQLNPLVEEALMADPGYLEGLINSNWSRVAEIAQQRLGRQLNVEPLSVNTLHWGGYCVVDAHTRDLVGSCAFKAPPDNHGSIEIAYFTYPEFEGRGYATQMARQLIHLASQSPDVCIVVAHTLPQPSASTHLLEKLHMSFTGEVVDPEDGTVWRWEKPIERSAD